MSRVCSFRAALSHASSAPKGWGLGLLLLVLLVTGLAWIVEQIHGPSRRQHEELHQRMHRETDRPLICRDVHPPLS